MSQNSSKVIFKGAALINMFFFAWLFQLYVHLHSQHFSDPLMHSHFPLSRKTNHAKLTSAGHPSLMMPTC